MMDIQLKELIKHLQNKGYECIPIDKLNGNFVDIDILTTICGKEIRLRCKFSKSFPYSFPKIYILREFYKSIEPLPHINDYGYICTFDNNVSFPNHKRPSELAEESIKKAIKIIEDGLNGINREDFIEEFNSYWDMDANNIREMFVLSSLNETSQILNFAYDVKKNLYIGCEVSQIKEYLKYAEGLLVDNKDIRRCLYIPLNNKWYPPYPKTNREMYLKVKQEKEAFEFYYKYLKDKTEHIVIIFSQELKGKKYFAGWIHPAVQSPKGFRKGKILPEINYLMHYKDRKIIKFNVNQLNRRRLFTRGGDGNIMYNCKVTITGCGSIGSFLIQTLSELGIDDFILIDNDILSSENIARHMCGSFNIGESKTEAIKQQLIKHYPYVKCESISGDVLDMLEKNLDIFNKCDINFVVVGYKPIESKFLEFFNEGKINKPIIIIWVEPFLFGGHAIIVQNKQNFEEILYDAEYKFKYSILADGSKFTKKEAGCQSTYIPYAAFEAKQFMYSFMDYFYSNHMVKKKDGNYLFSWCGDLKVARKKDIMITDEWLSKKKRTVSIKRLDSND